MKPNITNSHLRDNGFLDEDGVISPAELRLNSLSAGEFDYSVESMVAQFEGWMLHGMTVVPDTNVAIDRRFDPLWDAMARHRKRFGAIPCMLTEPILYELREWLGEPRRRQSLCSLIRNGIQSGAWLETFGISSLPRSHAAVLCYYLALLRRRRTAALELPGGVAYDGTPYNRTSILTKVESTFGWRAYRIAAKGLRDHERYGKVKFKDEEHVLLAFFYALLTGRSTVIVTADWDVYETFYKLQYLLDTHYRAYRVGVGIKNGTYEFVDRRDATSSKFWPFVGVCDCYRKRSDRFIECLPDDYASVPIGVMYLAPNSPTISMMLFSGIRELNNLFDTKYMASGRNSLQFPGRNVHVVLGMMGATFEGLVGVASDKAYSVECGFEIGIVDVLMCLASQERFARVQSSDLD